MQTAIGVAYGTDIDLMETVIVETVRGVEGVLPEKPVDVLFVAYGPSARQIRVRWWIDNVNEQVYTVNRVNAALERALAGAGIDVPFPTYNLNLRTSSGSGDRPAGAPPDTGDSRPGF